MRGYKRAVWVMLAEHLATWYSRLSGWLLLRLKCWLTTLALLSPAALAPLGACRALAACWLELLATPATCPLAFGARSLAESGPYFALGRILVTFTLMSDSAAGRPLLRGAALTTRGRHTQRLVCQSSPCRGSATFWRQALGLRSLALTLRRGQASPLLRRAQSLCCPYLALGRELGVILGGQVAEACTTSGRVSPAHGRSTASASPGTDSAREPGVLTRPVCQGY